MLGRTTRMATLALLALPVLGGAGCAVKKTTRLSPQQIRPLLSATLEELLSKLQQQAAAVHSLNAVTELVPSTGSAYSGVIEQYRDVRAFVLAQRSVNSSDSSHPRRWRGQQIRMIGQAPIVRKKIFDMVADDHSFRIHLPTKHKFIVGPTTLTRRSDKPMENLRPQHLLEALFPAAPLAGALHLLEENEFSGRRYYAVSEVVHEAGEDGRLARKWWFDRTDLALVRVQRFGPSGRLLADIHYARWQDAGGVPYPRTIELIRPHDDYRLKLLIKELTLNEPLAPEKFHLEKPAGAELVELKEKDQSDNSAATPATAQEDGR
ncbi:MAG: hypothetical protein ACE1Z1_06660 [Candidatus Acidiferrales bacterium]